MNSPHQKLPRLKANTEHTTAAASPQRTSREHLRSWNLPETRHTLSSIALASKKAVPENPQTWLVDRGACDSAVILDSFTLEQRVAREAVERRDVERLRAKGWR